MSWGRRNLEAIPLYPILPILWESTMSGPVIMGSQFWLFLYLQAFHRKMDKWSRMTSPTGPLSAIQFRDLLFWDRVLSEKRYISDHFLEKWYQVEKKNKIRIKSYHFQSNFVHQSITFLQKKIIKYAQKISRNSYLLFLPFLNFKCPRDRFWNFSHKNLRWPFRRSYFNLSSNNPFLANTDSNKSLTNMRCSSTAEVALTNPIQIR